jgi:hypothetical protein
MCEIYNAGFEYDSYYGPPFVEIGSARSPMMGSRNTYGSWLDCYFSENPCYFYYLPLAFDL